MPIASSHNGGRSQLDINGGRGGLSFPLIDLSHIGNPWVLADLSAAADPNDLDSNGYPNAALGSAIWTAHNGIGTQTDIPSQAQRPGNWIFKGTSTAAAGQPGGTVYLYATGLTVTATGPTFRQVFTPPSEGLNLDFAIRSRGSGGYINKLALIHVDDEALYDAGDVVSPILKSTIADLGCGILRFHDAQHSSASNVINWEHRTPLGHIDYNMQWRAEYWGGLTGGTGNNYTLTGLSGFTLTDKRIVHLRFDRNAVPTGADESGSSGDPQSYTLNINGTGAKPLLRANASPIWFNVSPHTANHGTVVYDADLDAYLLWGGTFIIRCGITGGWPIELCLRIAAETGCHPHFNVPFMACDPWSNWALQLLTYIRDWAATNAPWMKPRIAGPNETWNFASGYDVSNYAVQKSKVHWPSLIANGDYWLVNNWYGRVASRYGQDASAVYSNDRTKYRTILEVHTGSISNADSSVADIRLGAPAYVADGGTPASDWMTSVGPTSYWDLLYLFVGGGDYATRASIMATYAASYAAATTDAQRESIREAFVTEAKAYTIPFFLDQWRAWRDWADDNGLTVEPYEGGYTSAENASPGDERTLLWATRVSPQVVTLTLHMFKEAAWDSYAALNLSADNYWSIINPTIFDVRSATFEAMRLYNQRKSRLHLRGGA